MRLHGHRVGCSLSGLVLGCALLPSHAHAQVVELSGGASTLYQSQGATLRVLSPSYETGLSGGTSDGHFLIGSYVRHVTPAASYTAGLQNFDLSLPTDIFGGEHRLSGIGIGVHRGRLPNRFLDAFAGASSTRLDSPYVQGASRLQPAAALLISRPVTPHLTLSSQLLATSTLTAVQGVEWRPSRSLQLAAAGGFADRAHYGSASIDLRRPRQDFQAEYVSAGRNFHRTGGQPDLSPEFVRENISYTLRSSVVPRFTLTAARQNFLIPETISSFAIPAAPGSVSSLDEISVSQAIRSLHLSGSILHSVYDGQSNLAYTVSATFPVTRKIDLQSSFFNSRLIVGQGTATSSFVSSIREKLNSRMSVSQTFNRSAGQTNVGFGGSLLSNFGTLSVDYQTVYIVARPTNPFQQTLLLDLQLNLLGRLLLHAGTLVSPTGKTLYTADARAVQGISHTPTASVQHSTLGNSLLQCRVVDTQGTPIAGAAIELNGVLNFTDTEGNFFLRERKPTIHPYHVAVNDFLDGLNYRVVSQPRQLASSREPQPPSVIVVTYAQAQ